MLSRAHSLVAPGLSRSDPRRSTTTTLGHCCVWPVHHSRLDCSCLPPVALSFFCLLASLCVCVCVCVCVSVPRLPTGTAIPWRSPTLLLDLPVLTLQRAWLLRRSVSGSSVTQSLWRTDCPALGYLGHSQLRCLSCAALGRSGARSLRWSALSQHPWHSALRSADLSVSHPRARRSPASTPDARRPMAISRSCAQHTALGNLGLSSGFHCLDAPALCSACLVSACSPALGSS